MEKEFKFTKFGDFMREREMNESAVGERGRTSVKDAEEFITDEKIAEFSKIVKKLGGKTVARLLLSKLNSKGDKVSNDGDETLDDIDGLDIYDAPHYKGSVTDQ